MPESGSRSGAEIREDLRSGSAVSWRFTPGEKRLSLTLPPVFGGKTHEVCLTGGYTFVAVQPGNYEVKVSKEGFRAATESQVDVTSNNATRVDIGLQVGSASESVTVESTAVTYCGTQLVWVTR